MIATLRRVAISVAASASCLLAQAGCAQERGADSAAALTGGDPQRGRLLAKQYGCGSCHEIPGVRGAVGQVGPPLRSMARRLSVAGHLPNTASNMVSWISRPDQVNPRSLMPELGVGEANAQHIAAYLYTLE